MMMIDIGTVRSLYRYPVKSMRGESLRTACLRWQGIDGDRQYAFYRAANTSRFPWLTGREVSEIVTYAARYLDHVGFQLRKCEMNVSLTVQHALNHRLQHFEACLDHRALSPSLY